MKRVLCATLGVAMLTSLAAPGLAVASSASPQEDGALPIVELYGNPSGVTFSSDGFRSVPVMDVREAEPLGFLSLAKPARRMPYVEGEVLVTTGDADVHADRLAGSLAGLSRVESLTGSEDVFRVELVDGMSVEDALEEYKDLPGVEAVQPNYIYTVCGTVPNDPYFSVLWGLHNTGEVIGIADADIDAVEAWDTTRGRDRTVVAVIDSGVDLRHRDFATNIWVNRHEIPGNGVDDDGNGYKDDVYGWDFFDNDADPDDSFGHGTHCAGTIAAKGNDGYGVAGVSWDATVMALRAGGNDGLLSTAAITEAVAYADKMGADIVNCSFGGAYEDPVLKNAIASSEMLFVCAAGNEGTDNDASPFYPTSWDLPNIISVAATNYNDEKWEFSNYGATSVDVGAPGVQVLSTVPTDRKAESGRRFLDEMNTLNNWSAKRYWKKPWALTDKQCWSPSRSVAQVDPGSPEWAWLVLKRPIDLSGATKPIVQLKVNSNLVPGDDFVHVWVSHDGKKGSLFPYSEALEGWYRIYADISSFKGDSSVYFALVFASDTGRTGSPNAVFVDDFEVFAHGIPNPYEPWGISDGTSMAAPHVAGTAALLKSYNPDLTTEQMRQILIDTVDPLPSLAGKVVSGGRINADRALDAVPTPSYPSVDRFAGRDRFSVGVDVARAAFYDDDNSWSGVENVIVASGDDRAAADPLAAAGLSWALDAPVFLVGANTSPPEVKAALKEIVTENGSVKVHLVGGKTSLPSARVNDVLAAARSAGTATVVKRYGDGVGRYALASQIAATVRDTYVTRNGTKPPVALVANGADASKFFDALALSPIAASKGYPILLTRGDVLPGETAAFLKALACGRTVVAGGKYTVSSSVLAEIKSCTGGTVERWSGRTRYDTAVAVADKAVSEGWLARSKVLVTAKLPDGLTGGSMLGRSGAVLLLTESSTLSRPTDLWFLDEHDFVEECHLLGGTMSIKSGAEKRVRHCLR